MSVAEVFLRGGTPSTSLVDFEKSYSSRYDAWCWVVVFRRQWHHNPATNVLSAPIFHLLLAQEMSGENWHLLCATVQPDCRDYKAIVNRVAETFTRVPSGLRPSSLTVLAAVEQAATHETLGLFLETQWLEAMQVLPARLATGSQAPTALQFSCSAFCDGQLRRGGTSLFTNETPLLSTLRGEGDAAGGRANFWILIQEAAAWVATRSGLVGAADASLPPLQQSGSLDELLELLPDLQSLLWSSRFTDAASLKRLCQGSAPNPETLSGRPRIKAQVEAGRESLKARIGDWTSFVLDDIAAHPAVEATAADSSSLTRVAATAAAPSFRYAILLQRPRAVKRPVDLDNRDVGPLTPQPIGAEVHLFPDPGDALKILEQLQDTGMLEFHFEDYLHEDGEVLLQLGPVEGVPFVDIDALVATAAAAPEAFLPFTSSPPLCEGSCSGLVFPRVVRRQPSGQHVKANPLAALHAEIHLSSPTTLMVKQAMVALRYLSSHAGAVDTAITPSVQGYTLMDVEHIEATSYKLEKRCTWCRRRRLQLLRCSGCRCAWYCCKVHQAQDWRDGDHKLTCALWKTAQELQATTIAPAVAAMASSGAASQRTTLGASCAAVVADLLRGSPLPPSEVGRYVHILGLPDGQSVADMIAAIGATCPIPTTALVRIVCFADQLAEHEYHTVHAILKNGGTQLLLPTGQLGDVWHMHGVDMAPVMMLLRLCPSKYHLYSAPAEEQRHLASILFMGPPDGTGISFFCGALSTIAPLLGQVHVRITDSALVGIAKSARAMLSTMESLTMMTPAVGHTKAVLTAAASAKTVGSVLSIRTDLMCTETYQEPTSAVEEESATPIPHTGPVPRYLNSFQLDLPPVEAQ